MSTGLFLGVDPGLSGAVALVNADGGFVLVEDMPTIGSGRGTVRREVDAVALARLLRPHASDIAFCVIERVGAMPKQGLSSTFSLGRSLGVVEAIVAALEIPHALLPAAKWKRLAGLGADKGAVRAAAARRWPTAPLDRVKDHDRAEALWLGLLAIQHAPGFNPGPPRGDGHSAEATLPAGARDTPAGDSAKSTIIINRR